MSDSACDFPKEYLVIYQDGELCGAPLEITEAHLRACRSCRQWLADMAEVDRLLGEAIPIRDAPSGRAALKERIEHLPPPLPPRSEPFQRGRALIVGLLLLVILAGSLGWGDAVVEGGSSFTRWWRQESADSGVVPSGHADPTAVMAPAGIPAAPELPFDLALVATGRDEDGFIERFYRNPDGLAISVSHDRRGTSWLTPSDDAQRRHIIGINGRDVVVTYGRTPREVTAMSWAAGEALVLVFVLEQPPGGFTPDQAVELAMALMTADSGS
jgi:hypothetical protein